MTSSPAPQADPLLERYIDARKQGIEVESYKNVSVNSAFKMRTWGYWSGIAMGLTWGTIVGAVTALALPLIAPEVTAATMWKMAGVMAAIGIVSGGTAGQIIGAAGGAAAGAMEEKERREKEEALEQAIRLNPPSSEIMALAVEEAARSPRKSTVYSVEDIHAESGGSYSGTYWNMFRAKPLILSGLLGTVVGAVMALGGRSIINEILGANVSIGITAAMGALIGGVSGTSFGIRFPDIFTSLTQVTSRVLSGAIFERQASEPAPAPEMDAPQITEAAAPPPRRNLSLPGAELVSVQRVEQRAQSGIALQQ